MSSSTKSIPTTPSKAKPKPKDKIPSVKKIPKLQRDLSYKQPGLTDGSSTHKKFWNEINLIFKYPFDYIRFIQNTLLRPKKASDDSPRRADSPPKILLYFNKVKDAASLNTRLLKYLLKSRTVLLIAAISLLATGISQVKLPEIVSSIIDAIIVRHNPVAMNDMAELFFKYCVIYALSEFFYGYLFNKLGTRIQMSLKEEVFCGLILRDMQYFDKVSPSDIINHIDGQIYALQNICAKEFPNLARNSMIVVYTVWNLTFQSYKLTFFLITIIPIYLILSFGYSYFHDKLVKSESESYSKTSNSVLETFNNIKMIKASSTENTEIEKYRQLLQENAAASHNKNLIWSLNISATGLLTNFTLLLVIYMGMTLINVGEITAGKLCSYILYIIVLSSAFRDASNNYNLIKGSLPICRDLFVLIDANSRMVYKKGNTITNFQGDVVFKNVTFSYPETPNKQTLKGISFNINSGSQVAFVGPNNAGKSSIISLLLRFYDEYKGEIKIDGVNLKDLDTKWLNQQIGYLTEETVIFEGTLEENITYGLESYSKEKLNKTVKLANADFIFNRNLFPNGLQTNMSEESHKFSAGQKKRIEIARSLMKDPKILIFDEVMNGLDADSELEVQKAIDNLLEYSLITTIFVSQKLASVVKIKNIFMVVDGKIVEQGSHKELIMKDGAYKSLFEKQYLTR